MLSPPGASTEDNTAQDQRIGDILVRMGKMAPEHVEQARAYQLTRGERFGEAAVALGLVTDAEVRWALSQQFHYPYMLDSAAKHCSELVVAADPFCKQAEAIRQLRSQLLMGALSLERPRQALAIVSPDRGDGKSFVAANLAIALSQLGARTLLIDADMRQPRLHRMFDMEPTTGLSGILSGRSSPALARIAGLQNLFVLPVGTMPPNPLELLLRPTFKFMIRDFLGKFDYVLVDTPAATHGSDVNVIANCCGTALAVGRQNRTPLERIDALIKSLAGHGSVRLVGVVMNQH